MKAILETQKFTGKTILHGPYSEEEAERKKRVFESKKIVVSMDFPKPVCLSSYQIIKLETVGAN